MANGYIYILTNPSFPEYIKIGYTADVQKRLKSLNNKSSVPFSFRVYATYEVDSESSDKKLHHIIDKLNPNLRATEYIDGKKRVREFYAMSPEDAYDIIKSIAEIDEKSSKLKKWDVLQTGIEDIQSTQETDETHHLPPFSFAACEIPIGAEIQFCPSAHEESDIICKVKDARKVEYMGKISSMTALAKKFLNTDKPLQGTKYFKYQGEWLNDIRRRKNV